MYTYGGKALKIGDKLVIANDPTIIEIGVSATCFPQNISAAINFAITNIGLNEMYIDYADGTGVKTYLMNGSFAQSNGILYYYQDLLNPSKINTVDDTYVQLRVIKMRFKFPQKITGIAFVNVRMFGDFPMGVGNYNLSTILRIQASNFIAAFPTSFRGINTAVLNLSFVTQNVVNVLPDWISNSRITSLTLGGNFAFNGIPSFTNLDKLINTIGLTSLVIQGLNVNSVPANFQNIATLRTLGTGGSLFTQLPAEISNISQLTELTISSSNGSGFIPGFSNWNNGVGLIINLVKLDYVFTSTITTDLPTGIINCTRIKTINCGGSFQTLARTNTHFTNWYNLVNSNGDIVITASNNLRNVSFSMFFQVSNSIRPSGTYQMPSGFSLGVSNGTPASVMEMIWVLVTQYKWTIIIINTAGNGSQILN